MLSCIINKDAKWHSVISDPRKNMLIDLKNESQEEEQKDFSLEISSLAKIDIGDLSAGATIFAI